jgi:hypothetical protein
MQVTGSLLISGSSIRISGSQVDYVLNATSSTQYSRLSFEENGVDKAQVQYINSGFASGNRAGRLELSNAATGGAGISFISAVASFNTPQMIILPSGNVGIGTPNPSRLLHLSSSSDVYIQIDRGSITSLFGTDNIGTYIGQQGAFDLRLITNATERMRITSAGVVNISSDVSSLPSSALTVFVSGSGAGSAGNQIWLRGGNTNVTSNSNAIVLSYGGSLSYPHAIKTIHNSAAINGNAIDFYVWNYGTDAIGTIGTRKMMSIDGLGVIKPNQPAFQVTRGNSGNQVITSGVDEILQFNTVRFDTQSNFNTSTYRFVAPVAGRYQFSATARFDNTTAGGYMRTYFTVNGSSGTGGSYNYGHVIAGSGGFSTSYQSLSISAVIQLAAGDYVMVQGGHTTRTEFQSESQFSGYLLG